MITNKKYTKEEIQKNVNLYINQLTSEVMKDKEIIDIYDRMTWKQNQRLLDSFMGYRREDE